MLRAMFNDEVHFMYVIYRAFDDDTAEVLDITNNNRMLLGTSELKTLAAKENVLGLSVSNNKVNYITAYTPIFFVSDVEAEEYIRENGLTQRSLFDCNGAYYVIEKSGRVYHVSYFVYNKVGNDITYVGEKCSNGRFSYTPYIQAAAEYRKDEAYKLAASLTKNSKTGKYWFVQRIVND